MAKNIKTRGALKKGADAANKALSAGDKMKRAYQNFREHIRQLSPEPRNNQSAESKASDQVEEAGEKVVRRVGNRLIHKKKKHNGKVAPDSVKSPAQKQDIPIKTKAASKSSGGQVNQSQNTPTHKKNSPVKSKQALSSTNNPGMKSPQANKLQQQHMKKSLASSQNTQVPNSSGKIPNSSAGKQTSTPAGNSQKAFKQKPKVEPKNARSNAKKTIKQHPKIEPKSAKRTIKTAENATKKATKAGHKTAQSVKTIATSMQKAGATKRAAQRTFQITKAAAKTAEKLIQQIMKATVSAVKAIIAAAQSLVSALSAGGIVVVAVLIIICMVGLLLSSPFGIFFSGKAEGYTVKDVVNEFNIEYLERIEDIKSSVSYDFVKISGNRAEWAEILAVYAVYTNGNAESPLDVVNMDEERASILSFIFWEMNEINYDTNTISYTSHSTEYDQDGNAYTVSTTYYETTLYIYISHLTAEEMAERLNFTSRQRESLAELLLPEYAYLWNYVLYGVRGAEDGIVAVAITQIGNVGGEPYWSWYGFNEHVNWCACFVSWCANECGYIEAGIIPKFSSCTTGMN